MTATRSPSAACGSGPPKQAHRMGRLAPALAGLALLAAASAPAQAQCLGGGAGTLPAPAVQFLRSYRAAFGAPARIAIDAAGNIFDKFGSCPLVDPTAGECNSGPFVAGVTPFWDAGQQVPDPGLNAGKQIPPDTALQQNIGHQ